MGVLGVPLPTVATFVGFGLLVGFIFGFFGMGSFLVTPILLVLGYDSTVAVGSGLAFVFGTAVIATLTHRDRGQVSPSLGLVTIVGTTAGIEVGKRGLLALRSAGMADSVVGGTYVVLLGTVGALVVSDVRSDDGLSSRSGSTLSDRFTDAIARMRPAVPRRPSLALPDGGSVSVWSLAAITFLTGVPAGLLGIGGGFIRIPALTSLVGLSVPVAVGTNVFAITISGGIGAFSWAQAGGVDLSVVGPLLAGSAFGARLGSSVTPYVAAEESRAYFGTLLVLAAGALALKRFGTEMGRPWLRLVGIGLVVGAALVVVGLVLRRAILTIRSGDGPTTVPSD